MSALPTLRALLCSGVFVILAGCSSTKVSRVGDANLRITDRCTTFDLLVGADYIYDLEFPQVSLSERGEHIFHVRGLSTCWPARRWLMMPVIDQLVASGRVLGPGQCYGYRLLPVLGGGYKAEDRVVLPIREHFGACGALHCQIADLPDGSRVKIEVTE